MDAGSKLLRVSRMNDKHFLDKLWPQGIYIIYVFDKIKSFLRRVQGSSLRFFADTCAFL